MQKIIPPLLIIVLMLSVAFAAEARENPTGTITGKVFDSDSGEPLIDAQVVTVGDSGFGASTDLNGVFVIQGVPYGVYELKASFIGSMGQAEQSKEVQLFTDLLEVDFKLKGVAIVREVVDVHFNFDRVKQEEKTMAVTSISKEEIEISLGNRDISESIEKTNSVFVHEDGGGAGDTRINIRGFDERNVAVMINGVPVNGMENGKIYWSNWAGLSDVTSDIQVQRGMGASSLAISSVGGTMNIITDAAKMKPEIKFKREIGMDSYRNLTLSISTGLLNHGPLKDKLAFSGSFVRKTGEGFIDKGWIDGYSYFAAASYLPAPNHAFQLSYAGAPQQHGQRYGSQPIAVWDTEYAIELGVDTLFFDGVERGLKYSPNWGFINTFGTELKEYYNGKIRDVHDNTYLNDNVNYYHKPQANLNWFWTVNNNLKLTNIFYFSTGEGGGSRQRASNGVYVEENDYGQLDFMRTIRANSHNIDPEYSDSLNKSETILYNAVNEHHWYGWIGKGKYALLKTDEFDLDLTAGLDFRYYEGKHFGEVRNLLGGDYYVETKDANAESDMKILGDKVNYHNDGLVRWFGGFGLAELRTAKMYTFANIALSNISYKRVDYFLEKIAGEWNEIGWESFNGYGVKVGANYNLNDQLQAYGNIGRLSQAPAFNGVYNFYQEKYEDITNETVTSFELGTSYLVKKKANNSNVKMIEADLNWYYTIWEDKTWTRSVKDRVTDQYYNYQFNGIDAVHQGLELSLIERPHKLVKVEWKMSLGDWQWRNDVLSFFSPQENPQLIDSVFAYIDGLKVSDAPQISMVFDLTLYPVKGAYLSLLLRDYRDHFARFSPTDRDVPREAGKQPWKIPGYSLVDLHFGYTFPQSESVPVTIQLKGDVFNLMDEHYITSAWEGQFHDAETATVYMGRSRTWNVGMVVTY
ncbi:MAG: TonB-dependent receptor [Calditrichaeota bacterium]|nr:TonB-dependent receptor [Calditrichota bacterium]